SGTNGEAMPNDTTIVNINNKGIDQNSFDAIVIGSGMSGGWAAKELCDHGLRTLVLERGRDVKHIKDYPTTNINPWDFRHRGRMPIRKLEENPIVARCYAYGESTDHFFVKDKEHPYVQEKPFDWIRGYQVGGKSLLWARATQRWSKYDFEGAVRDGIADWPIRYEDIAPWYSHVEICAGISGNKDGLETMPDGEFLPPWELNCVEKDIQQKINDNYKDRRVIIGRCAHLTQPKEIHLQQGRGKCQARVVCERGCPYGGYFTSVSSTLPWAEKTGNMTLLPHSVVHSVIYDDKKGKAIGVRVINALTKQATEYFAKVIFVNAACLNTNLILLNSTSNRFPNGLGNDHDILGRYIAFQNYRGSLNATLDHLEDGYYYGRRPVSPLMPCFRNVYKQDTDFLRGYLVFWGAYRDRGTENNNNPIGVTFKDAM